MHLPSFSAAGPSSPHNPTAIQADRPRRPRPAAGPEGPWWRQPAPPRR